MLKKIKYEVCRQFPRISFPFKSDSPEKGHSSKAIRLKWNNIENLGWWVKIDLTRTNQVERQSRRQILTQARTIFEQDYQISAPADILPLALAFVFVRRPLGRAMLVCVFVFVLFCICFCLSSWIWFPLTFV